MKNNNFPGLWLATVGDDIHCGFFYQTLRTNDDGQNYSTWWTDMESSVLASSNK